MDNSGIHQQQIRPTAKQIVLNVRAGGSTSNISPNASNANGRDWKETLYGAVVRVDWGKVRQIVQEHPEAVRDVISVLGETLLIVAISLGRDASFIQNVVDLMTPDELALTNPGCLNALHEAVLMLNIPVVKLLVEKNPELPNKREGKNYLPIHLAALGGQREMTFYLHAITNVDEIFNQHQRPPNDLIHCAVAAGMFDFALHLLLHSPVSLWSSWTRGSPLLSLAREPSQFPSGIELNVLQSTIYSCIPMKYSAEVLESLIQEEKTKYLNQTGVQSTTQSSRVFEELRRLLGTALDKLVQPIKDIHQLKLKHCLVLELVKTICKEIEKLDETSIYTAIPTTFCLAVQNGIHEMVEVILEAFPLALRLMDEKRLTAFQYAASYRRAKIFNMLYKKIGPHKQILVDAALDDNGNSILHLVASKSMQNQLDNRSGVLQMQRELQWYKGMEKLVLPQIRMLKDGRGKTPLMLFEEEHRDMVANESQWIIGMANSCIVGASLTAAVVFAAAITVPGGNNSDGLPIFSSAAFKVFAFADGLALVCSVTTVLIFLSIFTARYSIYDHIYALPNRLIIGMISLFLSVTFMMIAFSAIVHLVFAEDRWIFIPTSSLACVPVIFFGYLQLPSLLKLIKSTYGPSLLKCEKP